MLHYLFENPKLNESKMSNNDLQLKIEVLQKTLEKKRQPSKFIDTSAAGSSFNSLTVAAAAAANVTTPTQLNSPNVNYDPFSNDTLFSLQVVSSSSSIPTPSARKTSLNGATPTNTTTTITTATNGSNSILENNQTMQSNSTTSDPTPIGHNPSNATNQEDHTSTNSLSTEDSSMTNSPTISSSSSSMTSSTSTSPSHPTQQQDDSNLTATPIKLQMLSTSIIENQENENDDKSNKESNNAR